MNKKQQLWFDEDQHQYKLVIERLEGHNNSNKNA